RGDEKITAEVRRTRRVARQVYRVVRLAYVRTVRVGVGVHGDRVDPDRPAGGEDPAGDLAPVGDEQPADHADLQVSVRPLWTVVSAMPNAVRVSRGSITTSATVSAPG